MNSIVPIIGVLALFVAPLIGYLAAARRFSGKIATSDASDLWEESRSIRTWSQERIRELGETVAHMENRVRDLETSNDSLFLENSHLLQEVDKLRRELASA